MIIKPLKQGMISTAGGNEYEVLSSELENYISGDIVIVEDAYVVKAMVKGKEFFFVKEENVLAVYDPKEPEL